jgi:hypothetical protein
MIRIMITAAMCAASFAAIAQTAAPGGPDPYSQGARATDSRDPYTQGARVDDKFDPYTQGANQSVRTDLAPVAADRTKPAPMGTMPSDRTIHGSGRETPGMERRTDRNPFMEGS